MCKSIKKWPKEGGRIPLVDFLKQTIGVYTGIIAVVCILDVMNISQYLPCITDRYDLLAFLGTMISGIAMIVVSIVATRQGESELAEQAILNKSHKIEYKITQRIEGNKLKLKITEPSGIVLTKISVSSIKVVLVQGATSIGTPVEIYAGNKKYHDLEHTDSNMDKDGAEDSLDGRDFYYVWLDININELRQENFFQEGEHYRFDIEMKTQNLFGVEVSYLSKLIAKYRQEYTSRQSNEPSMRFERFHTFGHYRKTEYTGGENR